MQTHIFSYLFPNPHTGALRVNVVLFHLTAMEIKVQGSGAFCERSHTQGISRKWPHIYFQSSYLLNRTG